MLKIYNRYGPNIKTALYLSLFYSVFKMILGYLLMASGGLEVSAANLSLIILPFLLHYLFYRTEGVFWLVAFFLFFLFTKIAYSLAVGLPFIGIGVKIAFSYFFIRAIIDTIRGKRSSIVIEQS